VRYRVLGFEESGVKILVYLMRLGKAIFRYDEKRKEIYSHREDDEALRIYMDRMRTESGVTRFTLTPSQEDMKKLEKFLKAKMDK